MDGILVVDKPSGFTSFDVVAKLRGICATKKIGHGGTLDPMATGVLPVFVGRAVKAVDRQVRQDKAYEAEVLFGRATDTGDVTGATREEKPVQVTAQQVQAVLPAFVGKQAQLPPMYSAVKVNGRPLYRYAREGKAVERKPREVEIFSIEYLGQNGENRHRIAVHCSKGTYIRTLAEDIGTALAAPATLAALRRTAAGMFTLPMAHTLEALQAAKDGGGLEKLLQPVETVFLPLPALALSEKEYACLQNGVALAGGARQPGRYRGRVEERFIGLLRVAEDGALRVEKLF